MPDLTEEMIVPADIAPVGGGENWFAWGSIAGPESAPRRSWRIFRSSISMPVQSWNPAKTYTVARQVGPVAEEIHLEIPDAGPPWAIPTVEGLVRVLQLLPGWSTHSSKQVTSQALNMAISVLNRVMRPDAPPPAVVPTSPGGVQFEWHQAGIDLEIEISPSGEARVLVEDLSTQGWEEGPLSRSSEGVSRAIARMIEAAQH